MRKLRFDCKWSAIFHQALLRTSSTKNVDCRQKTKNVDCRSKKNVVNVNLMTIMKDVKQGESYVR